MPVKPNSLRATRARRRRWLEDPCAERAAVPGISEAVSGRHSIAGKEAGDGCATPSGTHAHRERGRGSRWAGVARGDGVSGSGARRARVQVRAPLPVRSCPTAADRASGHRWAAIGTSAYSGGVWCGSRGRRRLRQRAEAVARIRAGGGSTGRPVAPEGHDRKRPIALGSSSRISAERTARYGLERRRRIRLDCLQELLRAGPDQRHSAWVIVREVGQTGGRRRALDRRSRRRARSGPAARRGRYGSSWTRWRR